jgi:hypothetical protein
MRRLRVAPRQKPDEAAARHYGESVRLMQNWSLPGLRGGALESGKGGEKLRKTLWKSRVTSKMIPR